MIEIIWIFVVKNDCQHFQDSSDQINSVGEKCWISNCQRYMFYWYSWNKWRQDPKSTTKFCYLYTEAKLISGFDLILIKANFKNISTKKFVLFSKNDKWNDISCFFIFKVLRKKKKKSKIRIFNFYIYFQNPESSVPGILGVPDKWIAPTILHYFLKSVQLKTIQI